MRTCDDECKFIERLSFEGGDCDCDRGCDRDRGRGWKGIRLPEGDSGGRRRHKTEPILSQHGPMGPRPHQFAGARRRDEQQRGSVHLYAFVF